MKLELFSISPTDADFTKGGYRYSKSDILKELEEVATDQFAIGETKDNVLYQWRSILDDYEIVTNKHKERAKYLIKTKIEKI